MDKLGMTIGGLAKLADVGVETVRYYQRRGLLAAPPRAGSVRRYGHADVERLRFIRSAQAAGFTLEEIGELIALDAHADRGRVRVMAEQRIAALDARIEALQRARASLARLATACARSGEGPCPILTAFDEQATAP